MDKIDTLRDGGTTIYKSKELDLTITVCNTIDKKKTYILIIIKVSLMKQCANNKLQFRS